MKNTPQLLIPQPTAGLAADASAPSPFEGALWFAASEAGDGFICDIVQGSLPQIPWFTSDLLNGGSSDLAMNLEFYEPGNGLLPHPQRWGSLVACRSGRVPFLVCRTGLRDAKNRIQHPRPAPGAGMAP